MSPAGHDISEAASMAIPGLLVLLHSDETDSSEHATSTAESAALKTYTLPPNGYSKIIVEAICRSRVEQDASTRCDFTWRIKSAGSTVKTFVIRIIGLATAGADSGDRSTDTLSTVITGGQTANTDLTITCQPSLSNAATGGLVHAFRVYAVV